MNDILLTITQAMQLVVLAPCVFVIAFLLSSAKHARDNIIPVCYFLSLAAAAVLPLLNIFGENESAGPLHAIMMTLATLGFALSFLLVIQFLHGKVPGAIYWSILFIPLIGGGPFIYLALYTREVCIDVKECYNTETIRIIYNFFSGALIFLLLMVQFARRFRNISADDEERAHKYWLILSLIALNVVLLFIDLLYIAGSIMVQQALLATTVLRITFIYVVLTSIFRVFYESFDLRFIRKSNSTPSGKAQYEHSKDRETVDKLRHLLESAHIYREPGLGRKDVAEKLGISEHQASRIVNTYFHKNLNELINDYRIREAKERLVSEDTQITVIAFDTGFNSIASFNRVFREATGSSPTEYRSFNKPLDLPST